MKTMTKKRPDAGAPKAGQADGARNLSGAYSTGLWNDAHAALLGKIVGSMPQVEELMIDMTALLLGDAGMPARPIFRGIAGDEARVNVLRALLERGETNTKKGPAFDAAIAGYAGARRRWRAYIQGLWYTHENGRTFLAAPTGTAASFLVAREVKTAELEAELDRLNELTETLLAIVQPAVKMRTPTVGRGGVRKTRPPEPEAGRAKQPAPKREPGKQRGPAVTV